MRPSKLCYLSFLIRLLSLTSRSHLVHSYFTYRAMLAHLHTTSTPFFYDPIHLLLELDLRNLESPAFFDSELRLFLEQIAADTKAHPLWAGVESCSSHAMYRLSDRYSLDELRELCFGYIVRSLTVETVSFCVALPSLDKEAKLAVDK